MYIFVGEAVFLFQKKGIYIHSFFILPCLTPTLLATALWCNYQGRCERGIEPPTPRGGCGRVRGACPPGWLGSAATPSYERARGERVRNSNENAQSHAEYTPLGRCHASDKAAASVVDESLLNPCNLHYNL